MPALGAVSERLLQLRGEQEERGEGAATSLDSGQVVVTAEGIVISLSTQSLICSRPIALAAVDAPTLVEALLPSTTRQAPYPWDNETEEVC